jgi:hypothetical protein
VLVNSSILAPTLHISDSPGLLDFSVGRGPHGWNSFSLVEKHRYSSTTYEPVFTTVQEHSSRMLRSRSKHGSFQSLFDATLAIFVENEDGVRKRRVLASGKTDPGGREAFTAFSSFAFFLQLTLSWSSRSAPIELSACSARQTGKRRNSRSRK